MSLKHINASNGSGEAVRATVTAIRAAGSTTITVDALTNWPNFFIATSGTALADGSLSPGTVLVFAGHKSGSQIVIDTVAPGYTDAGNTVGQVVVVKPSTMWADNIQDVLAESHNDDGTLKAKSVTLPAINGGTTAGVLTTDASGNVSVATFPKFSAYRTASQTVANSDTVVFTAEAYDVGSGFNTSTGVFTAPTDGTYSFTWKLETSTATAILSGLSYGSGGIKRGSWNGQGPYISTEGSADIYLTAGQTAKVIIVDIQGATKTINGSDQMCYFMGRLLP